MFAYLRSSVPREPLPTMEQNPGPSEMPRRCRSPRGRVAMMKGEAPKLPKIEVPTCVRRAEHDPVLPYAWTDRLSETFAHLDLAQFSDVGHSPPGKIQIGQQKRSLVFSDESAGIKTTGTVALLTLRPSAFSQPLRVFSRLPAAPTVCGEAFWKR